MRCFPRRGRLFALAIAGVLSGEDRAMSVPLGVYIRLSLVMFFEYAVWALGRRCWPPACWGR